MVGKREEKGEVFASLEFQISRGSLRIVRRTLVIWSRSGKIDTRLILAASFSKQFLLLCEEERYHGVLQSSLWTTLD